MQDALTEALEEEVARIAEQVLADELPSALSSALSGDAFDTILKNSLDRISDGKQDETILVNGGGSESGGPVYDA